MITIKALALDFGGVLCRFPNENQYKYIADKCGLELDVFKELYFGFRPEFDRGAISGTRYWRDIIEGGGGVFSEEILNELIEEDNLLWSDINPHILSWAGNVRDRGVKTAIISNMPVSFKDYLNRSFEWVKEFEPRIFSCDVKVNKPDSGIYRACLESLELQPREVLFIDDVEKNVHGATDIGMHSLLFTSIKDLSGKISGSFNLPPIQNGLK